MTEDEYHASEDENLRPEFINPFEESNDFELKSKTEKVKASFEPVVDFIKSLQTLTPEQRESSSEFLLNGFDGEKATIMAKLSNVAHLCGVSGIQAGFMPYDSGNMPVPQGAFSGNFFVSIDPAVIESNGGKVAHEYLEKLCVHHIGEISKAINEMVERHRGQ